MTSSTSVENDEEEIIPRRKVAVKYKKTPEQQKLADEQAEKFKQEDEANRQEKEND